jgi:hypothetical protein
MWRSQETLPEEVQHNPLLPTSSEEKSPPKSKIRGLQAPLTRWHRQLKRQRKKVRSHSRPPSPQSLMWRSQIRGLKAPPTRQHRLPRRQRKKSEVIAGRPRLRAGCGDLRRHYQRRNSITPCCPPAQRRNPRPNPRFRVYKHLRPSGTVCQKGSEKKSEVRPSPQSWMWRSQIRGLQATPTRRHRLPIRQRKKVRSHSQPAALASESDVEISGSLEGAGEQVEHTCLLAQHDVRVRGG